MDNDGANYDVTNFAEVIELLHDLTTEMQSHEPDEDFISETADKLLASTETRFAIGTVTAEASFDMGDKRLRVTLQFTVDDIDSEDT